jgi:UDP-glucose 4-epimerase
VTGGAGFIGSHLVRGLLERGLEVTVLDNFSTGTRSAVDRRARIVEGDVRCRPDIEQALKGADCVFHLAAKVSIRASFEMFYEDVETNLMGTANLLRSLDPGSVRHFALASSMAVYADSRSPSPIPEDHLQEPAAPYGVSKLAAERICSQILRQADIPFFALRYFNTFGPGQKFTPYVGVINIFATKLLKGQAPVIFGDGEQARDFVHVEDIVAGTIATLSGPPGTYNLGTGRATTVNQIAALLIRRIQPNAKPVYAPMPAGELRYAIADITAASEKLSYRPQRSIETDTEPVIDYIRRNLGTVKSE